MCFAAFKGWPCPTLFFNVHVRPSYMTFFSIVRKSFPFLTRGSLEKKRPFLRKETATNRKDQRMVQEAFYTTLNLLPNMERLRAKVWCSISSKANSEVAAAHHPYLRLR